MTSRHHAWEAKTYGIQLGTFLHIHSTVPRVLRHSPPRCSSPREFGRSRTRPSWSWQTGRSCSSCRPVRRTVGQSVRLTHHVHIRAHRYRQMRRPFQKRASCLSLPNTYLHGGSCLPCGRKVQIFFAVPGLQMLLRILNVPVKPKSNTLAVVQHSLE